ncbi:MAG: hypothetical protein P4L22_01525 [Candidatus Babeliales bacterium]|nr:hypothetical protein [Candidatus Babeliales bacterium]
MKKIMFVCLIINIFISIQGHTVLFKQPGTVSFEDLALEANEKNPAALKTLSAAWQPDGDAAKYPFIGDYLIKQGLSASQVTAKTNAIAANVPVHGKPALNLFDEIKQHNKPVTPTKIKNETEIKLEKLELLAKNFISSGINPSQNKLLETYINQIKNIIAHKTFNKEEIDGLINSLTFGVNDLLKNLHFNNGIRAKNKHLHSSHSLFWEYEEDYKDLTNPKDEDNDEDEWGPSSVPAPVVVPKPTVIPAAKPIIPAAKPAGPAAQDTVKFAHTNLDNYLNNAYFKALTADQQAKVNGYVKQLAELELVNKHGHKFKDAESRLSEFMLDLTDHKKLFRDRALRKLNSSSDKLEEMVK